MEQENRKKRRNAGMSLIEIIVVVMILGILSAGATFGLSYIHSMDASSAAEEIVSLLERTRLNTISAEEGANIRLEIKKESDGYYGIIWRGTTEVEKMSLGGRSLSIKVTDAGGGTTVIDTASCVFSFQKSNGAFQSSYKRIEITGTKTSVVSLVIATGRSYVGD